MSILYSLIARKRDVLAEYTAAQVTGNFPTVTRVLLTKISQQDGRMSYSYDQHIFHYIVDEGITFLCMGTQECKARITFTYLEDIIKLWREKYAAIEQIALAFSLDEAFRPILKERMEFYDKAKDNFSVVQAKIDSVKEIMVDNIDKVLERGEKIELLVDKTDRLNQQAFKFEKSSRSLKRAIWWSGVKNKCIIAIVVLLIIFFIVAMICGLSIDRCLPAKTKS